MTLKDGGLPKSATAEESITESIVSPPPDKGEALEDSRVLEHSPREWAAEDEGKPIGDAEALHEGEDAADQIGRPAEDIGEEGEGGRAVHRVRRQESAAPREAPLESKQAKHAEQGAQEAKAKRSSTRQATQKYVFHVK